MTEAWENEVGAATSGLARGSDDTYCSVAPLDGHHYVSHSVQALPVRWVEICSLCGRVNGAALREEMEVKNVCATCEKTFPDPASANAHVVQEHRGLDQFTTRQLLEELRMRGDLFMVGQPCSDAGADGAIVSAIAAAALRALTEPTLAYRTADLS